MKFRFNRYPRHVQDSPSLAVQGLLFLWEVVKVVVISLAIIVPVRYFLIKPFYVKGASMEPNYFDHEYLIIDEISYRFSEPARGDVVVFRYPGDPSQFFIKRVVGLPGERVVIADNAVKLYTDTHPSGITLVEPYLPAGTPTLGNVDLTLRADEYYVLGDNRASSLDSRAFGAITRRAIVGQTLVRGWPLQRAGLLEREVYYQF